MHWRYAQPRISLTRWVISLNYSRRTLDGVWRALNMCSGGRQRRGWSCEGKWVFEFVWRFYALRGGGGGGYALSASEAIFRARTYSLSLSLSGGVYALSAAEAIFRARAYSFSLSLSGGVYALSAAEAIFRARAYSFSLSLSGGVYALSAAEAIFRARAYSFSLSLSGGGGGLRPVGSWGHLQGESIQSYNLFSPVIIITWWMKLGGNLPPGLLSISGTYGIFYIPSRTETKRKWYKIWYKGWPD